MKNILMTATLLALPLGVTACGKPAEAPKAETTTDAMGDMTMPAVAKMAKGTGTVTVIDSASGKITLDHGPMPELEWPAMKMGFTAKPELLKGIAVGDKVDFNLTVTGNAGEVTSIQKR